MRRVVLAVVRWGGGGATREPTPPRPAPSEPTSRSKASAPLAKCPPAIDLVDLMSRHARAFGSPDGVARSLPVTLLGEVETGDKKGRAQMVLGKAGYRGTNALPGFFT